MTTDPSGSVGPQGAGETAGAPPDDGPAPEAPVPAESSPSAVPELLPDTPMQKVVLPGVVDLLLGNITVPGRFDPHRVAGFVTRLEDVANGTASELTHRYGLDQVPGWPSSADLHVLRFYAHSPLTFLVPFERNVYRMELLEFPAGTELWRIDDYGSEQRIAAYLHRQIGWVGTAPVVLGPGRWNQPPVPLRPSVRRGLVARYHGSDFDADFGPRPGEVTLHPLPGYAVPEGFVEQAGTYARAAPIDDLDCLDLLRWRLTWHGLPVELVECGPNQAVVHYLGDDGQRATELGLAEVDYRVWQGVIRRAELPEVHQERVSLGG